MFVRRLLLASSLSLLGPLSLAANPANPAVTAAPDAFQTTTLVTLQQSWRLWDTGAAPAATWAQPDFDDSAWTATAGMVALRADQQDLDRLRQTVPPHPLAHPETAYLRTSFEAPALTASPDVRLLLDLVIRDGAVIYLNGQEVGRTPTMPAGPVTHTTGADRAPRLRIKAGFFIDPALLRTGRNALALSLHSVSDTEPARDQRAAAVELNLVRGWDRRPLTTMPEHVRVQWRNDPQTQAVVSWTTGSAGSEHHLHFDTVPRRGRLAAYAQRQPRSHGGPFPLTRNDLNFGTRPGHFQHVHLTGLTPDTTYHFVVVSDGEASREFNFRTAPADDRPVTVVFGGDSRIGGSTPYLHQDRRTMNRRIAALTEAHPETLAFIHGGDFAQTAQWRHLALWLYDHELITTQDGRILPIIPARGNHDLDIGFEQAFWWPSPPGQHYYPTTLTPHVTLLTLNTEISLGGRQQQWLAERLAERRPLSRWLVASYHRPAWPSVRAFTDGASRRQFWVPLFEQHRVDLVLESHDHALKRTVPILRNARHPDGVTYIGDGGLGVPQRDPDPTRWYLQDGGLTRATHHVHLLEFGADTLRGRAFGPGGEVVDDFTLTRRTGVAWGGASAAAPGELSPGAAP